MFSVSEFFFPPDKVNHVRSGLLPAASSLLEVEVNPVDLEIILPPGNLFASSFNACDDHIILGIQLSLKLQFQACVCLCYRTG